MTDPTQPESGQEQVNQGLPTPTFTETSAGSSTSSVDTEALIEAVLNRLTPQLEKKLQSTKDKRIANIEKQLGIRDLEELEAMGATIPESVKLEHRLRQLEGTRQSTPPQAQTPTSPGSGANLTAQDVAEVVKKFQLDANDPDVIGALRGTYRNRDHFENTLAHLALTRATRPPSDASGSASLPGSAGKQTDKAKQIETGYLEEMKTVRRGDVRGVSRVQAKWKKIAAEAGLQLNV